MRATSVGEYLVLFGALIAVVATAVISLGRLIVFQAQTADQRSAQSLADELSSMIDEVAAAPDGSYYDLPSNNIPYNVTITTTQVVLQWRGKMASATHLARLIIPTNVDSTQQLCIQKSLGKILIKNGDCLACTPGDGWCDAGCDGMGRCDPDCVISGDGYCSRSCAALSDERCDLDCIGKGIWDPDCGCQTSDPTRPSPRGTCPSGQCSLNQTCVPSSGVLDSSWDPCCTGDDGVCDPDYPGCDSDCFVAPVCLGACGNYTDNDICFPACNNTACESCRYACHTGCSTQPPGWLDDQPCRLIVNQTSKYPLFLNLNLMSLKDECGVVRIDPDSFTLFYHGTEYPIGRMDTDETPILLWEPDKGVGQIYCGPGTGDVHLLETDVWSSGNILLNRNIKAVVEAGSITQLYLLPSTSNVASRLGSFEVESAIASSETKQHSSFVEMDIEYVNKRHKNIRVFSTVPGVQVVGDFGSRLQFSFPSTYRVSTEGDFGFAEGVQDAMVWCNGVNIGALNTTLSCLSPEAWVFLCQDCSDIKEWLRGKETQAFLHRLVDQSGYGPGCTER